MASDPTLPTLDRLNATVPASANPITIARDWLTTFSEAIAKQDNDASEELFLPDSYWRDILALTSDINSLEGWHKIKGLLHARRSHLSALRLLEEPHNAPTVDSLFPDLSVLLFAFGFDTPIGRGSGIVRLVPSAGQAGLEIAARLKQLDVPTLVLERQARIGDSVSHFVDGGKRRLSCIAQWRNRYDSLSLHDTVCKSILEPDGPTSLSNKFRSSGYDHPPYMP
ncbi:hypothetical protein H0H87_003754 [Tephrocybe sp. NHM501043]|nr:hypothetical protein H0H87_003754 [Tephrocybe sp. NHM501043]